MRVVLFLWQFLSQVMKKKQTLKDALEMLKTCLPDYAFYGAQFPKVVMTDNCHELRSSLSDVWPGAVSLLCLFHVLQQVWRWLFEKKNGISVEDRPKLLLAFKRIVYAESEEDMQNGFDDLVCDTASTYPGFLSMSPMFLKNVRHGQCVIVLNYL